MTYNYECTHCGIFEHEQSIKEDALTVCPKCGGTEIKRVFAGKYFGSIVFNGSGWTPKQH
jgi:putative FmdB family regulatory protein